MCWDSVVAGRRGGPALGPVWLKQQVPKVQGPSSLQKEGGLSALQKQTSRKGASLVTVLLGARWAPGSLGVCSGAEAPPLLFF